MTTRDCMELPDSVIDTIKQYGGRGINFCVLLLGWSGEVVVIG